MAATDKNGRLLRRGHTHMEFSKTRMPRLFTSYRAASYSLKWWLDGKVTKHYGVDFNGNNFEDLKIEKDPSRKASEMEIRQCKVVLV